MFNLIKYAEWAYKGNVTQVVGVPDPIGMTITPGVGNMFLLKSITLVAGTFGGARTISINHVNSGAAQLMKLMSVALTTGQVVTGPNLRVNVSTILADTVNAIGAPFLPYYIGGTDYFAIHGAALANTEVLTFLLRGLILTGNLPTTTVVGTGVTLTESYSRVQ